MYLMSPLHVIPVTPVFTCACSVNAGEKHSQALWLSSISYDLLRTQSAPQTIVLHLFYSRSIPNISIETSK